MSSIKNQSELLASLHLTVLCLHQYFDALATFLAELNESLKADPDTFSPDLLETLLTQYLAVHFDSTIRDHAGITSPQNPADLLPLLEKILTSSQEYTASLPDDEQPRSRKAGLS